MALLGRKYLRAIFFLRTIRSKISDLVRGCLTLLFLFQLRCRSPLAKINRKGALYIAEKMNRQNKHVNELQQVKQK